MLNNKGQSLILFVIMLPILLLIFVLVIDIGKVIVLKQELDNINNIVLDYGMDNLDKVNIEDELIDLVKLNNNEIDEIDIYVKDNKIYSNLNEKFEGMFLQFVDVSIFNVKSSYVGYMDDNEKRIERIVGD